MMKFDQGHQNTYVNVRLNGGCPEAKLERSCVMLWKIVWYVMKDHVNAFRSNYFRSFRGCCDDEIWPRSSKLACTCQFERKASFLLFVYIFLFIDQNVSGYKSISDLYLFIHLFCILPNYIIIINPLTARIAGAPQMILQLVYSIFPCSPLPSGTCRTPGLSILLCCLPTSSSDSVPCKMVLARPDERETLPYHCSLRLFTIVTRSSCGPIACWIFARTSSLVIWSLYEMCSILR